MTRDSKRFTYVLLLPGVAAGAWLSLAGIYLSYMRHARDFASAEYRDVVLPWRWDDFRRKRGEHYLALAEQKLRQRDAPGALHYFRAGLSLAPANTDGRYRLAALYHAANRQDLAAETLVAGFPHIPNDADYARIVLQYLLDTGDGTKAERIGTEILSSDRIPIGHTAGIALLAARASFQLGHYEHMERLLARHCRDSEPGAIWLRARTNLEIGYPELARNELEAAVAAGTTFGPIFETLAADYRARGDAEREGRLLVQALNAAPLAHQPHLAMLKFQLANPRSAPIDGEVRKYLRLFSQDESALLALADLAATRGLPALASMTRAAARSQPAFAEIPFLLLEAEAHLSARQYAECLRQLDDLARQEIPARLRPVITGLRAVAMYGSNQAEDGRNHLGQLLADKQTTGGNLAAIAAKFSALGHVQPARQLLAKAHRDDPQNQRVLTELLQLELDAGLSPDFPALTRAYLDLAKPSPPLLPRLHRILASDRFLLLPDQPRLLAALEQADTANRRGR